MESLLLLVVFLIFALVLLFSGPSAEGFWDKGSAGESLVSGYLQSMLDADQYHVIENVTLPTRHGTVQIDHIVVSVYGVFVIETKNRTGWIFGKPQWRTWTQTIYEDSYRFQNPLIQNSRHVQVLRAILRLSLHQIHSVIVFVGNSDFKTEMPENVTYDIECIDFIESKQKKVLTKTQTAKIIEKIEAVRLPPSSKTEHRHKEYAQTVKEKKEDGFAPACPRCGSSMVVRKARQGRNTGRMFWGCRRYPQCRGIVNAA